MFLPFCFCSVQASHPEVPETAVIGYPHDIKGEGETRKELWSCSHHSPTVKTTASGGWCQGVYG